MTRLGGGLLLTVALAATALTGCSPSADEVNDAVGDLPGVVSAQPSCHEFLCTVEIEAEAEASAVELADMFAAARTVDDAWDIEVSVASDAPGGVSALLEIDKSPPAEDTTVGALLAWAAAEDDLSGLTVERGREDAIQVSGSAVGETNVWPLARAAWDFATELHGAELDFTRAERPAQQSIRVTQDFPDDAVAVAEELEADDFKPTGVVITNDRFLVGTISRTAAEALRPTVTGDPRLEGMSVEVVVSTNVLLASMSEEPGTSQRLEPVLAALEGQPGVLFATILGSTIEVDVDDLRSAPALVQRVRRRAGAAFVDTTLVLVDDRDRRVEITPDGDDAVLDLVVALLASPGLAELEAEQELEPDPERAEVALSFTVRQSGPGTGSAPPLGPEVSRLARLLSTTPGNAASYALGLTVQDSEGRAASAGWRVDRTADGLVLGEVNGTEEQQREVRAAWARGLD